MVIDSLLNLKEYIASKPGVCAINFQEAKPANEKLISEWEVSNKLVLPKDVKDFYLTCNGVEFSWFSVVGDIKYLTGQMKINKVTELVKCACSLVGSESDSESVSVIESFSTDILNMGFQTWPVMFELETCPGSLTIVYVFQSHASGVYLLDRDLQMHKICNTFKQYIRLSIANLCLRSWQTFYTPSGPSPIIQQYAALYIPERLFMNSAWLRTQIEANRRTMNWTYPNLTELLKTGPQR